MFYVFGLGNPGAQYQHTRHNLGRDIVLAFARLHTFPEFRKDGAAQALFSRGAVAESEALLVLPETFMNLSGASVKSLLKEPSAARRILENLLVVHDELDLPFGAIRISYDRSAGGHNGVQSIADALGTQAFGRVRIGIAPLGEDALAHKPQGEDAVSRFVLNSFAPHERERLREIEARAMDAIETYIQEGKEAAMRTYNADI